MLQVVKLPLARRLWRLAKLFHRPISELADMIPEELDFYDLATIADDPKALERYENTYVDDEYDAWEKAFDEEMRAKREQEALMRKQERDELVEDGYDVTVDVPDDEEWERV